MDVFKGSTEKLESYICQDRDGKHLLEYILNWAEKAEIGDFLETGNYVIVRVKDGRAS